jgi:DNA-binding transcriptional LysR family regulator
VNTILLPKLTPLMQDHSHPNLEINTNYDLVDIVEQRYDAGVRLVEQVNKDMIAMRIGRTSAWLWSVRPRISLRARYH